MPASYKTLAWCAGCGRAFKLVQATAGIASFGKSAQCKPPSRAFLGCLWRSDSAVLVCSQYGEDAVKDQGMGGGGGAADIFDLFGMGGMGGRSRSARERRSEDVVHR